MKVWYWLEPGPDDQPIINQITEDDILRTFYPYWAGEMLKVHKLPMITEQNCIDDFVVVNWASSEKPIIHV